MTCGMQDFVKSRSLELQELSVSHAVWAELSAEIGA